MSDQKTNPREPLEKLKKYSAFQVLRAKAETHQLQNPAASSVTSIPATSKTVHDSRRSYFLPLNELATCKMAKKCKTLRTVTLPSCAGILANDGFEDMNNQ